MARNKQHTSLPPASSIELQATLRAACHMMTPGGEATRIMRQAERIASPQPPKPSVGYDGQGAPEHVSARDFVYVDGQRESVEGPQNVNTDRIEWLFAHGEIGQRQHAAAVRLHSDWKQSQIVPFASTVMVGAVSGGGFDHGRVYVQKASAMRAHGAAIAALGYGAAIVQAVVEENMTIAKAAAFYRLGEKQTKGILALALHFLADHYGLPHDDAAGRGKVRGGAALPIPLRTPTTP